MTRWNWIKSSIRKLMSITASGMKLSPSGVCSMQEKLTPDQACSRYLALWNLVMKNGLQVNERLHTQKLLDLQPYYDALQKLNNRK